MRALLPALLVGCGFTAPADDRTQRSFVHASIGTTVTLSDEDVTNYEGAFLQPDTASPGGMRRIPAEHLRPSTWSAELDSVLPFQFYLPDYPTPLLRVWTYPQQQVRGIFPVLEHPNPQPAPTGSILAVTVLLDHAVVGGETFRLFTVGSWALSDLAVTAGASQLAMTVAHSAMTSLSGRPHIAITLDDKALVLRYGGPALTGVFTAAPFTETGADNLTGALMPLVADQRLAIQIDRDAAGNRLLGATPALTTIDSNWFVIAAPGASAGATSGPALNSGMVAPGTTMLDAPYANPFASLAWPALAFWQVYGNRTVTTRLLPVTLNAGIFEYRVAGEGGTSTLPAGLPQGLTFDGETLSTDNDVLPLPTHPVEVAFLNDRPDTSTVFQVNLYELVPNASNTQLTYKFIVAFNGPQPRFTVPADLFKPGTLYTIRAMASAGGYDPQALAAGDLSKRVWPYAGGYLDSGVFELQ